MKIIHHYLKKMSSWLLPYTCILCGQLSERPEDICEACYQDLPYLKTACLRCALPLSTKLTCGFCLQYSPSFSATYALFSYEAPITRLILELKFLHALTHARLLGEWLSQKIQHEWYQKKTLPQRIIPMPMHATRLKERGFNQAVEIAKPIADALQLPLDITSCQRLKQTTAQASLSRKQRLTNLKNAFAVTGNLKGQYVAVIDDVITTGNTMMEFCNTLKEHGVAQMDVWCCARTALKK